MGGGGSIHRGHHDPHVEFEPWYKWGVAFLYFEMVVAIVVTIFSLYLAFSGKAGFLKH